jgi:hypothetical protein
MTFEEILEAARLATMTDEERAPQRLSFVYGNLKIDNDSLRRETVDEIAQRFEPVA